MENYPSNSHKTRELIATQEAKPEEKKKIEKVVTTPVKTKKKSGLGKFFGNLVSDNAQDIKTYVVSDVIIVHNVHNVHNVLNDAIAGSYLSLRVLTP